jgi:hypothetical protein
MDDCRTDAFRRQVSTGPPLVSAPAPGVSMTSGPVDVASDCLELSTWSLPSADVRTSFWKE